MVSFDRQLIDDALLPVAGLPAEAVASLRCAFAREVQLRLPRLLGAARGEDAGSAGGSVDAHVLAEGCALLGDAASARALRHLGQLLREGSDSQDRGTAATTAALLLGRWLQDRDGASDPI